MVKHGGLRRYLGYPRYTAATCRRGATREKVGEGEEGEEGHSVLLTFRAFRAFRAFPSLPQQKREGWMTTPPSRTEA
jgi:hypothetical protein